MGSILLVGEILWLCLFPELMGAVSLAEVLGHKETASEYLLGYPVGGGKEVETLASGGRRGPVPPDAHLGVRKVSLGPGTYPE